MITTKDEELTSINKRLATKEQELSYANGRITSMAKEIDALRWELAKACNGRIRAKTQATEAFSEYVTAQSEALK
ncbi:hypothetical protein V6N13_064583 [Hibiscus sabdariffa]